MPTKKESWDLKTLVILSCVCILLLGVPYLMTNSYSVGSDARAHIFRMLYFYNGMSAGDYVPIQYGGYSFLSEYGYLFYMAGYALFSVISITKVSLILASFYSYVILTVATGILLSYAAFSIIRENAKPKLGTNTMVLSALFLLIFIVPFIEIRNSLPYALSFAFSLLAFRYILRLREAESRNAGTLAFIWAFSVLALYTETFGYLFMIPNLVALLLISRRHFAILIPMIAASTAFSWVQLLYTMKYVSPLFDGFVESYFSAFYFVFEAIVLIAMALLLLDMRRGRGDIGKNPNTYFLILFSFYFILLALTTLKHQFGLTYGPLDGTIYGLLQSRLTVLVFPVLFIVTLFVNLEKAMALAGRRYRFGSLRYKVAVVFCIILIGFSYAPFVTGYDLGKLSAGNFSQITGNKISVLPSDIYSSGSPVVFSPLYNYSTATGPYSQGDPSFYSLTMYSEWDDVFPNTYPCSINLLQLMGSDEVLTNKFDAASALNATFMGRYDNNSIYKVNVTRADSVTPILLLAPNQSEALRFSQFTNILGKDGYLLTFTQNPVPHMAGTVVLPGYKGSVGNAYPIVRIASSGSNFLTALNSTNYLLSTTALQMINRSLYDLNDENLLPENVIFPVLSSGAIQNATFLSNTLYSVLRPVYAPVNLSISGSSYAVGSSALPVLLKASYYPYFSSTADVNYTYSIYRYIILSSGGTTLKWGLPYYSLSLVVSLVSVAAIAVFFVAASGCRGNVKAAKGRKRK